MLEVVLSLIRLIYVIDIAVFDVNHFYKKNISTHTINHEIFLCIYMEKWK